jgi:hypothetical protein
LPNSTAACIALNAKSPVFIGLRAFGGFLDLRASVPPPPSRSYWYRETGSDNLAYALAIRWKTIADASWTGLKRHAILFGGDGARRGKKICPSEGVLDQEYKPWRGSLPAVV